MTLSEIRAQAIVPALALLLWTDPASLEAGTLTDEMLEQGWPVA